MKRDKLSEEIRKALKIAPLMKGYSIQKLAEMTNTPWSTTRWHLEAMESEGIVGYVTVGRAKLYSLIEDTSTEKTEGDDSKD